MKVHAATDMKAFTASILVHGLAVVIVSIATLAQSRNTLELTGASGIGGGKLISLDGISLSKSVRTKAAPVAAKAPAKTVETSNFPAAKTAATHESTNTNVTQSVTSHASSVGPAGSGGSGGGAGGGIGFGTGAGDFDGGVLFSQIKKHFETRLGSSLVIKEDQLIKIKISLESDGTVSGADLIQGKLDVATLRRILSVARNIPLKNLWKSSVAIPSELIIPLVLTTNS